MEINYIVFEKPADKAICLQNKPDREKPGLVKPDVVKPSNYISNNNILNNNNDDNHSVRELTKMITYIVSRVVDRDFLDEDNNEIKNRNGYLKSSLEQNWR